MAKIGLICEATVPPGMEVTVTIGEDVDRDGEDEYEATQSLEDGRYVYVLDGFEASEESNWSNTVGLGRDDENYNYTTADNPEPPAISSVQLLLPGGPESGELDPNAIIWKFREVDYYLNQMQQDPGENIPFKLGGFLNAVYSIDEVIQWDWDDWAQSEAQKDLHDLILKLRHQYVHLRKPARGSIKPPLTQSIKWNFGDPSKLVRGQYIFDVPQSVIDEYVDENELLQTVSDDQSEENSPFARIVPVVPICRLYTETLFRYLSDWFDGLDNSEYQFHINSLLTD